MGLNLNIQRIIFSTLKKFDGKKKRVLTALEVRQIAGFIYIYIYYFLIEK